MTTAAVKKTDYNLFDRLFNRWTKWELHEENVPQIQVTYNSPILGSEVVHKGHVIVDVYVRENKFNGLKKYKKVVKK